jgi:opacity protein-like surface antigen
MLKRIIIAGLVFLSLQSKAQNNNSDYQFAIHFNPIVSWMTSDNKSLDTPGASLGIDLGLDADKYFAANYALNTGISIGSFGGFVKPSSDVNIFKGYYSHKDTSVKIKTQYVTIPLGFKFRTDKIGLLTYYAQIGVNNQFRIKSKAYSDDASIDGASINSDINFFNFGYYIGAGVEYKISTSAALVGGITYSSYFTDALDNEKWSVYQRNLTFRLGIRF